MSLRTFIYLIHEGLNTIRRQPATTGAAVLSISASLLVLAIILVFTANLERHARRIETRRVIDVYVSDDLTLGNRVQLEGALRVIEGVASVTYISKEEALENFRIDVGRHDLVDALGYNPLPASFRLEPREEARSGAHLRAIADAASSLPGVDDVRYGADWIDRLDRALIGLRLVDLAAALLVGLAAMFAVSSTIQLAVLTRREMIEIMKVVGATDSYISTPFLFEGVCESLAAAGATLLALRLLTALLAGRLGTVQFLPGWEVAAFLGFAALLGLAGSRMALAAVLGRSA